MKSELIFNINDIGVKKILSNDKIKIICDECGKKEFIRYFTYKNNKINLCRGCKIARTNMIRYGVRGYCATPEALKARIKKAKIKKIKSPNEYYKNKIAGSEKRKITCLKKYGVENISQLKEIKNKVKQTNIKKYGTNHPCKNNKIKNKIKQTNLKLYGVGNAMQRKDIKAKVEKTCMKKYGVNNIAQSQKFKDIMVERYGAEYTYQSNKLRTIIDNTMIKRYGVTHALQNASLHKKQLSALGISQKLKTINENLHYQNNYELNCINYCIDNNIKIWDGPSISYKWNNTKHIYHIDFETNKYLIEIKGNHSWYKENIINGKIKAKAKAAIKYAKSIKKEFLFLLDIKDYSKHIKN